jgi:hypothetical protein
MAELSVRIVGGEQAIRALRTMEPETAKQINRQIADIGKDLAAYIRDAAPSAPPMRNWRTTPPASPGKPRSPGGGRGGAGWPAWQSPTTTSSRRGTNVTVTMIGAAAAIYESAGKEGKIESTSGRQFIDNLPALSVSGRRPRRGRIVGRAIVTQYPDAIRRIQEACDRAVDEVNRRLPSWR